MGQAAGSVVAMAVKQGVSPPKADYGQLQNNLMKQGVPLPGVKIAVGA